MYGCERRENVHRVGCHIIIQFLILSGPIGISFQDNLVPSFLVKRDTRKIPNNLSIRLGFQLSIDLERSQARLEGRVEGSDQPSEHYRSPLLLLASRARDDRENPTGCC